MELTSFMNHTNGLLI